MAGFGKSRTGTGEGSGRRWRGADGPGGRGGMFEGSERPERAVPGRYEGRQTRQVPSALFCHFFTFSESSTAAPGAAGGASARTRCRKGSACRARAAGGARAGTDVAGTASAQTGVARRRPPAHSWTPRTANEPTHLKANLAGTATRDADRRSACDSPPLGGKPLDPARAPLPNNRTAPANLSRAGQPLPRRPTRPRRPTSPAPANLSRAGPPAPRAGQPLPRRPTSPAHPPSHAHVPTRRPRKTYQTYRRVEMAAG